MDEDNVPTPFNLTLSATDPDTPAENLSWNYTQPAHGSIAQPAANGASQVVQYTPEPNYSGTVTFSAQVQGGGYWSTPATITIQINPVNDSPALNTISDLTLAQDAGSQSIQLTGITPGPSENEALTITAASDNPGLTGALAIDYTGGSTATLRFTPLDGQSGEAVITVTVDDGQAQISRTFKVTVTAPDPEPDEWYLFLPAIIR